MAEEQNQQPAEAQDTPESEKEKKGKTVMVVIIIALVLFMGGGIYAVYRSTTSQAPPQESEEVEEVTEVIEEIAEEVMEATDEAEATEAGEATEAAEPEEEGSDDEAMIIEALLAKLGLTADEVEISFNIIAAAQAKGNVKEVGAVSGAYFLAAKDGGEWVIVYDGQANPPCADINQYDFSISIVPECMDASDNLVVR